MGIEEILIDCKKVINDFKKQYKNWVVIIRWATATGKSKLSIMLADFFDCEIISSDSRQIFKYMDIWTDKVSSEIRNRIPHHLIDFINPSEHYTAWQRKNDAEIVIENIQKRGRLPIVVGWTWLYIDTIYKNFSMPDSPPDYPFRDKLFKKEEIEPWFLYNELLKIDPIETKKIHPKSTRYLVRALEIFHTTWKPKSEIMVTNPVKQPILMIWLRRSKDDSNKLIDVRVEQMIKDWLIQETEKLLSMWYSPTLQSMQWIGYKQTVEFLNWKYDKETLIQEIQNATHHLAKKQRTRFRRYIADQKDNPKTNVTYKVYELYS
jgi:tRNA dimethylallyltransferase